MVLGILLESRLTRTVKKINQTASTYQKKKKNQTASYEIQAVRTYPVRLGTPSNLILEMV